MTTEATPETTAEAPEITPAKFKIESFDDLKRMLTIARGGDPDAIQAITNFMDFKSPIERSYFPDKKTTICIAQLMGLGDVYFPQEDWEPFGLVAKSLAIAFMPYKGFKSDQFVKMTMTQPDLSGLQTTQDDTKRGLLDRVLRRGGSE